MGENIVEQFWNLVLMPHISKEDPVHIQLRERVDWGLDGEPLLDFDDEFGKDPHRSYRSVELYLDYHGTREVCEEYLGRTTLITDDSIHSIFYDGQQRTLLRHEIGLRMRRIQFMNKTISFQGMGLDQYMGATDVDKFILKNRPETLGLISVSPL